MGTETNERLSKYIDYLIPILRTQVLVMEEGKVIYNKATYCHKKLLPYVGSKIQLSEYSDRLTLFTKDGLLIIELCKDVLGSK